MTAKFISLIARDAREAMALLPSEGDGLELDAKRKQIDAANNTVRCESCADVFMC